MEYSMLLCIDGNESQKRRLRVKKKGDNSLEVTERTDTRQRKSFFFLESNKVDVFKDEVKKGSKVKSKAQDSHNSVRELVIIYVWF